MENLIVTIVKPLVDNPDSVSVTTDELSSKVIYTLHVHEDDMGRIIGKQGRVINAIRSIVFAAGSRQPKKVFLELHE